ncbi:hypothetical protein [Lactobacillus delbrueckii]|uniref:hypothetical protein n=1 Tax=Lactobacillus delbrueckii TaxID=1584 RepID=UPI001E5DD59C|nr:hypothetical protein [Lactobacillus delbrueckii]MCD5434738.1 hypothetical protein [Lactobacillus delbrueckii subsp. lactis]MCD5488704.1 hypothetical protein [Lactobacillus delbrueckii subsp. lactis]
MQVVGKARYLPGFFSQRIWPGLSRKQFTLLRLRWSWPYLACLFVIHLIYWPGSWLAAVSLILLFAAAAGMTLYQRRYLGGIKDSIWVFAVFALLRLLTTLLFKI